MDEQNGERPDIWGPSAAAIEAMTSPKTLGQTASQGLYRDIVSGRLPPGHKLKPEELKARYGVGTSPIREALLRLSAEGLVELEGQRGFRVPHTSEAELVDIANVRAMLSVASLQRSIAQGDEDWEAQIVAAFHRLERLAEHLVRDPERHFEEWERRNREFHLALESACGSPWLLHFAHVAFSQSERYRRHFVAYGVLLPDAQDEHRAIMDAALRRDAEAAGAHLRNHIMKGMEIVRQRMRAAGVTNQ